MMETRDRIDVDTLCDISDVDEVNKQLFFDPFYIGCLYQVHVSQILTSNKIYILTLALITLHLFTYFGLRCNN